jgi:hypothetical protein
MVSGESREERNRRIAVEALTLLDRAARTDRVIAVEVEALHRRWEQRGVRWTRPRAFILDPADWLPAQILAEEIDVDAATIRRWALRGHISSRKSVQGKLFNVGEILAYRARRAGGVAAAR